MATIKSYSDLQQSKKLAEILPLKSADMKWFLWKEEIDAPKAPTFGYSKTAAESYKDTEAVYLPCWSLSALLGVLPYPYIEQNYKGKWTCRVEHGNTTYLWEDANPIDVCVAMIEQLHKLNLL